MGKIFTAGLTGGPCGGKSSVLAIIRQRVEDMGWIVYEVQEAATHLMEHGMKLKEAVRRKDWDRVIKYQREILRWSYNEYLVMCNCAKADGGNAFILVDRPLCDTRAYLPEGEYGDAIYCELLGEIGLTEAKAAGLYDIVVLMRTAADGAEEFYTLANNAARDETPEEARYLDKRIENAYLGHNHPRIIENPAEGGFEQKKANALREIAHAMGIPEPQEIERKYLIHLPEHPLFKVPVRAVDIEQMYLVAPPGEEMRIRRRGLGNSFTYYQTRKYSVRPGVRIEIEEAIDWFHYLQLSRERDPARAIIRKTRFCIFSNNRYFEIDAFREPTKLALMEVEVKSMDEQVRLPEFIKVIEEVTGNIEFSNSTIALRAA